MVECGVNVITNIGEDRKEVDRLMRVDLKMRELVSIAAELKRQKKLEKVVLLQRIPRFDEKSELSEFSNQAMLRAVCETNDPHGIIVRTLHLGGSQDSLWNSRFEKLKGPVSRRPSPPRAFWESCLHQSCH